MAGLESKQIPMWFLPIKIGIKFTFLNVICNIEGIFN
jgi:hypothetical protein